MSRNSIFRYTVIMILVFTGIVSGQSEKHMVEINNFVLKTYQEYANAEFDRVYNRLHPQIQEQLTRNDYLEYQRTNLDRYQLEIEEVKIEGVAEAEVLPPVLEDILKNAALKFYTVSIRYQAAFDTELGRQERELRKEVLVGGSEQGEEEKELYLLWDPSSVAEVEE